jgi:hypothetical protein
MRKRRRLVGVVILVMQMASVAAAQRVVTESGAISGISENGLSVYKGVPFAAPPVGDPRYMSHTGLERARRMRLHQRVCKLESPCRARRRPQ